MKDAVQLRRLVKHALEYSETTAKSQVLASVTRLKPPAVPSQRAADF
jgi:hypothetical protein